jgi:hypothetical protein
MRRHRPENNARTAFLGRALPQARLGFATIGKK